MRRTTTIITLAAALVALGACADEEDSAGDQGRPACLQLEHTEAVDWQEAFDATDAGAFLSVWGSGPCDVWAVGGQPDAGVAWHFDGATWSEVDVPDGVPLLNWVYGVDGEVFIVGNEGTAMRGTLEGGFTLVETPTDAPLWGVWGPSAERLWAVGGDAQDPDGEPVALSYEGGAWSSVDLPPNERGATALFKVWGTSADHALAVGQSGLVYRWDGERWEPLASGTGEDLISLWGTGPDDIVIIGGRSNAVAARYDGTSVNTEVLGGSPGMNGIWVDDDGVATIVGILGTAGTLDPGQSAAELDTTPTMDTLHGAFGVTGVVRFAVGGSLQRNPPYTGVVLVDP